MAARRIGQIFVDLGFITDEQLDMLVEEQSQNPGRLIGRIAMEMGLLDEDQLAQALAEQMNLQIIDLEGLDISDEVLEEVSDAMAQLYKVVPLRLSDGVLTVATCEPQNLSMEDELRRFLGYDIRLLIAIESQINKTIDRYYSEEQETLEKILEELENDTDLKKAAQELSGDGPINLTDVAELADSAPVRKLLNMVLLLAIKDHASDIHFEPFEDEFRIRIKSDGVLYEMVPPPRHLAFAITTRVKVMANLDIAERRLPQDGRIELSVGGHPVDLRVAVCPTMFGESVVMRVLDRSVVSLDLTKVGMDDETIGGFREVIEKPNGIVLVTGPTGSGKTTTLYSALSELNDIKEKLITTEDPVEYDIDGIVQIPIESDIGVTFAACLRAILRQDPDKILVGEIRDLETAEIAVQASLTGHLVFSTLHTNDAPSTVTRMKDMGVPTFLITATVEAILAQRLVRRICPDCREEIRPSDDQIFDLGLTTEMVDNEKFFRGGGCESCNNTGYKGRVGLFELMVLDDELRDMILNNKSSDELRTAAQKKGMVTLRDAGMSFVFNGTTTLDEVIRETILEA
ncbi:MAG: ATPase, T2SS/T4P/T4SS family [Planctomycetota bacterium]|jgi:type IV pilus assembly protein PilB|nr:ATPase, T2SS/T4P/T4SS family [Planctomycetota bacterium]MEC7353842.1 ATPase, T2SS/T4P/T4SS family [Planctomycetota bacterium]MEC7497566.1 ATPase, T2SS/T4P/T4SS family [Planctomycetota bacterium]MEC7603131.1 ATPase, T2SS/T4P/T4SS family [Planctomycetota bacterium]MEC7716186.1 ATPase, T2SS/T4P/T4SS family [Planctomycetota bacterium]